MFVHTRGLRGQLPALEVCTTTPPCSKPRVRARSSRLERVSILGHAPGFTPGRLRIGGARRARPGRGRGLRPTGVQHSSCGGATRGLRREVSGPALPAEVGSRAYAASSSTSVEESTSSLVHLVLLSMLKRGPLAQSSRRGRDRGRHSDRQSKQRRAGGRAGERESERESALGSRCPACSGPPCAPTCLACSPLYHVCRSCATRNSRTVCAHLATRAVEDAWHTHCRSRPCTLTGVAGLWGLEETGRQRQADAPR